MLVRAARRTYAQRRRILCCMRESTSIRVSCGTRDDLRSLAGQDGVTLDEAITRLVRAERQRRIGLSLAAVELDGDERSWLELGIQAVRDDAGG